MIRLRRGASPAANPGVRNTDVVRDAQEVSALGVAFSGGGIRSATYNLGVAQGLAEQDLWPQVDYLSTVSGGGYIGTWLHGVVRSKHDGAANTGGGAATTPSAAVFKKVNRTLLTGLDDEPGAPEHDPIAFLRKVHNILAPRTGLFSANTWVGGVVWVRNVLLNQLILAPTIAAVVMAAVLVVLLRQTSFYYASQQGLNPVSAIVALFGFLGAIAVMALNLKPIARRSISSKPDQMSSAERWRRGSCRSSRLACSCPPSPSPCSISHRCASRWRR